jgi:hypothetical protein
MYICKYARMLMEANIKKIYLHFVHPINKLKYRHMMIEANLKKIYLHFVQSIYRGKYADADWSQS